jgi:hypothetical protein
MPVRHSSVYVRPGNLDFPPPDDWNAPHLSPPLCCTLNAANVTWTNQPAALTELFGTVHRRARLDLTYASQSRVMAQVSTLGATSAILMAQYSVDETAWSNLSDPLAIGGGVAGTRVTAWTDIPVGALGDVYLRIVGQDGNGAADPILGVIQIQYR